MKEIIIPIILMLMITSASAGLEILGNSNDNEINIETPTTLITSTGNLTNFTDLLDTPDSYTGEGGNCVAVNVGETALEFVSCGSGSGDITSVLGDAWITNGSSSGAVNLVFNTTLFDFIVNNSISSLGVLLGFNSTYNSTYATYAYNETTICQAYTDSIVTTYNTTWSSTYNATYASMTASIGYYINYTPITTTGNITNGTLKGYLAANAICDYYYDGSHMCQTGEILNSINRNQSNVNFTATFRITEGAPGYLANANDCDGLISPSGSDLGAIWVGSTAHLNTYGSASLVSCSASRAIGCCI